MAICTYPDRPCRFQYEESGVRYCSNDVVCEVIEPPEPVTYPDVSDKISVVFDRNNPDSVAVAQAYAEFRNKDYNVEMVDLDLNWNWCEEYLSNANLKSRILEPLWATNPGRYIVTCWGVPLKSYATQSGDYYGAVDDLLHLPPPTTMYWTAVTNPVYCKDWILTSMPTPDNQFRFVGRLDGPTVDDALALIDRAKRAEEYGWQMPFIVLDDDSQTEELTASHLTMSQLGWGVMTNATNGKLTSFPPPSFYWGFYVATENHDLSGINWPKVWFAYSKYSSSMQKLHSLYFATGKFIRWGSFGTIGSVREPASSPFTRYDKFVDAFFKHGRSLGVAFSYATWFVRHMMVLVGDPLIRMPAMPNYGPLPVQPMPPPGPVPEP